MVLLFLFYGDIAGTKYKISMFYYQLESTDERRARRNNDIKALFQNLVVNEKMPCMEAYEAVGYQFYEQADAIRKILASINKSGKISHNSIHQKQ